MFDYEQPNQDMALIFKPTPADCVAANTLPPLLLAAQVTLAKADDDRLRAP
jgi:hypothetical protein